VTTEFGNGPGVLTNGIDYQINYSMPLFVGDFSIGGTATQILKLQDTKTELDGFTISNGDDRLGFLNFSGAAVAAPEWRVNAFTSYRFMDQHTLRFAANWQSAVSDDRPGIQWGEDGEDPVIFDLFYLFDLSDTLRLTASVENITDRDPPKHQTETGYDARLGNALGRTFEIGIKSTF
jgi:outer membrane receptor protein involved in Fe transport